MSQFEKKERKITNGQYSLHRAIECTRVLPSRSANKHSTNSVAMESNSLFDYLSVRRVEVPNQVYIYIHYSSVVYIYFCILISPYSILFAANSPAHQEALRCAHPVLMQWVKVHMSIFDDYLGAIEV